MNGHIGRRQFDSSSVYVAMSIKAKLIDAVELEKHRLRQGRLRCRRIVSSLSGRDFLTAGLVIFALFWLVFVWPTPWRYFKSGSTNLRVHRITGTTERLTTDGWRAR